MQYIGTSNSQNINSITHTRKVVIEQVEMKKKWAWNISAKQTQSHYTNTFGMLDRKYIVTENYTVN